MRVRLRKITKKDTPNIVKWRNDLTVRNNLFSRETISAEQHNDYFDKNIKTGKVYQYVIIANGCDCGTVFLKNIDKKNKKCEFGIFIGDSLFRGKGIGQKAAKLALNVAFSALNLNKVYLSVFKRNISAINSYKRVGFLIEGVLLDDYCDGDNFEDVVLMGLTKTMWTHLKKENE